MVELYTFEIAIASHSGQWEISVLREEMFTRHPEDIARGLLEQWINTNHDRLPGGRVFVRSGQIDGDPADIDGSVRIRVWQGGEAASRGTLPVAAAYLGHAVRGVPARPHLGRRLLHRARSAQQAAAGKAPHSHGHCHDGMGLVDDEDASGRPLARLRRSRRRAAA